jgi:integrase
MRRDMGKQSQQIVVAADKCQQDRRSLTLDKPRSLPIAEWPEADRLGWMEALRPAQRLKRGGAASHLAPVSHADIANRYGLYLDHLQRYGRLDHNDNVTILVTADGVEGFIAELQARVRSVTVWNSVYKLRRAAQLIAPSADFHWLTAIEKDIALTMAPRSKMDRLVLTERLVEAGLTLIQEAATFGKTALARAFGVRNGLLIVLLALHPIRIKNFAALTIGDTFINVDGCWWLHIPSDDMVNSYIETHRPVLCRGYEHPSLWVSSTTGQQLTTKNLGTLISKLTRQTIGVDVSPHLFRTAGASTAAFYGGDRPHLASALLGHRGSRVTQEHYNLSSSLGAGEDYAMITQLYRQRLGT